jgi:hypothetical protein
MAHQVNSTLSKFPLKSRAAEDMPLDLQVQCPYCRAEPHTPCVLIAWTHPARHAQAITAQKTGQLHPKPTFNSLPQNIKADIESFISENNLDTDVDVDTAAPARLFEYWCDWNGLIGYSEKLIEVLDALRSIR